MKPRGNYDAAYQRRVQLRIRLFKAYALTRPAACRLKGAARKSLLDQLEQENAKPRVWNWTFDHRGARHSQNYISDRPALKLYIAAVKLRAMQLRRLRDFGTARILDAHLQSLIDVAPRAAYCYYPREWREISRALRPFGSHPEAGTRAAELYAIYQHILKTHTVEEA